MIVVIMFLQVLIVAICSASFSFMIYQEMDTAGGGALSWFGAWRDRKFKDKANGNYHPIASVLGKCPWCMNIHVTWLTYLAVSLAVPGCLIEADMLQRVLFVLPVCAFSNAFMRILVGWLG